MEQPTDADIIEHFLCQCEHFLCQCEHFLRQYKLFLELELLGSSVRLPNDRS
jgi:hypothetical protein